jgi:hypothetical protein
MKVTQFTVIENAKLVESHLRKTNALVESVTYGYTAEQKHIVESIVNEFKPLIEYTLTPDQIQQIFGTVEKNAVASGNNRTALGKSVDVAKLPVQAVQSVNKLIDQFGGWLQTDTPVKDFDQKFENLKDSINKKFPDSKILDAISNMGAWAEKNPGKTAAIVGVLTAIASMAAGPVGGAVAGQVLRGTVGLMKGEKLSTAIGKGIKTAAFGFITGKAFELLGDYFADVRANIVDQNNFSRVTFDVSKTSQIGGGNNYIRWTDQLKDVNLKLLPDDAETVKFLVDKIGENGPGASEAFNKLSRLAKEFTSEDYKGMLKDIGEMARENDSLFNWIVNGREVMQSVSQGAIAAASTADSGKKAPAESLEVRLRNALSEEKARGVAEATEYGIPDSTPGQLPGGAKMTFGEFKKMWPGVILKRPSGGSLAGSVVADVEGWMNNPKSVWEPLQGVAEVAPGALRAVGGLATAALTGIGGALIGQMFAPFLGATAGGIAGAIGGYKAGAGATDALWDKVVDLFGSKENAEQAAMVHAQAAAAGEKSFEFGGKKYPVTLKPQDAQKLNLEGVAEGSLDDIEDTRQFRNAIALAKSQKTIRQAKHGKNTKFYSDGTPVTPKETARRAAERKARKQGAAEGSLNEFAPGGNSASSYYAVTANFVNDFNEQKEEELQDRIDSGFSKEEIADMKQGFASDMVYFEQVRDGFLKGMKPGFEAYQQGDTQMKDQLGEYWLENDLPLNQDWEKIYGEPWGDDTGFNEGMFGIMFSIDSKTKGAIQNVVAKLSDIPGMWDHAAQTFTDAGMDKLKTVLKNNPKHIKYAVNLTADDFEAESEEAGDNTLNEISLADIASGAKDLLGKAVDTAKQAGTNATNKITSDKLLKAWTKAGNPTDSEAIAKMLQDAGIELTDAQQAFADTGLDKPTGQDSAELVNNDEVNQYADIISKLSPAEKQQVIELLKKAAA